MGGGAFIRCHLRGKEYRKRGTDGEGNAMRKRKREIRRGERRLLTCTIQGGDEDQTGPQEEEKLEIKCSWPQVLGRAGKIKRRKNVYIRLLMWP